MYLVSEELMQDIQGMFVACKNTMIAAMSGAADSRDMDYLSVTIQHFTDRLKEIPFDPSVESKKIKTINREDVA